MSIRLLTTKTINANHTQIMKTPIAILALTMASGLAIGQPPQGRPPMPPAGMELPITLSVPPAENLRSTCHR